MKATIRHYLRRFAYSVPVLRSRIGTARTDSAFWDDALTGWAKSYIGETVSIDLMNAAIGAFIRYHAPGQPAVLDVGCAGGTLARNLHSFSRYHGTDISAVAVEQANATIQGENISFQAVDLADFEIRPEWDVIVFAEVLYYLPLTNAVETIKRYSQALRPGGIIIISMKHDGKAQAIYAALAAQFQWVNGLLWQEKNDGPEYRLRVNRERPAFLMGAITGVSLAGLVGGSNS